MKKSSRSLPMAATALLAAAVFAATAVAQAPQAAPPAAPPSGGPPRTFPAPTNLKVLPKNLTGQQVHDIMEQWQGSLGVHCNTCHTADPKNVGPNGRPRLNFADDTKEQKTTARMMFQMTEKINADYISKVPGADVGVTCGTCHRGHMDPEAFEIPKDDGPPPPQGPPPAHN